VKTSSAKAKGRRACQAVKDKLLAAFPNLSDDDIHVASAGQTGEDLMLSPKARKEIPLSFEVKNQERLQIYKALEQAKSNCGDYIPILAYTRNRSPIYVSLLLDDFLSLTSVKCEVCRTEHDIP